MASPEGTVLFNPGAGGLELESIARIEQRLRGTGVQFTTLTISAGQDVTRIAADCLSRGARWIAVAGGDGTIEAVAAAMVGSEIPLGVIPAGTFNNFALSLQLPDDPLAACEIIAAAKTRLIDVGCANGRPFFECAGAGLDAAIFPLSEKIKSGERRKWIDLLRRAYRYPRQSFILSMDRPLEEAIVCAPDGRPVIPRRERGGGRRLRVSALMVTASNGPFYGMNFHVAPGARIDDGLLTISIFRRYSKVELWWHFLSIAHGRRAYSPKSLVLRVSRVNVSGPRKLHVHLDGSIADLWPLDLECRHQALKVFS